MVDALKEEIEKLETEGQEIPDEEQDTEETTQEEGVVDDTQEGEQSEEAAQDEPEEPTEDEIALKQKAYKERQEAKKREAEERRQAELAAKADKAVENQSENDSENDSELQYMRMLARELQTRNLVEQDEKAFKIMEAEFKEAYPDYEDVVKSATEILKEKMVLQGMSEEQANFQIRKEKMLAANAAHLNRQDPVEAIYKESKMIVGFVESYIEKKGYQKPQGKPKTNLQAIREIAKTPAVGTGRGTGAAKKTFDEMEDLEEIGQVTLGDLMSGNV